jgi:hypothetical protein
MLLVIINSQRMLKRNVANRIKKKGIRIPLLKKSIKISIEIPPLQIT